MHPASQDKEILNFVSKKLATTPLSRRRSQTSTHQGNSTAHRSSRVEKPSSRHGSPKTHEKRSVNTASKYMPTATSTVPQGASVTSLSRPAIGHMHRPERPYSWHPTSQTTHDAPYFPCPNQFVTASFEYPTAWQLSSYEWPGEMQYANQRPSYDDTGLAPTVQQVDQFNTSKHCTNEHEIAFGAYPAWYTQHAGSGTIPMYPPAPFMVAQDVMQPISTFSTTHGSLHEQCNSADYNVVVPMQNNFQMVPPPMQHEIDLPLLQGKPTQEEELVGLGLYDREEDVSPLQLCSALSMSAPTQFSGQPAGKGLKLEETWQPPPEWQPGESTEGSEASASPYEEAQRYSSFDHDHVSFTQIPQQYPLDFGPNSFLLEAEDDWFVGSLKATPAPNMGLAAYDWFGSGTGNAPY